MVCSGWIPPASPLSLIQESVSHSEWLVLVSCIMLNQTNRRQVDGAFAQFVLTCPTPEDALAVDEAIVREIVRPLGFQNRRTAAIKKLAAAMASGAWMHVRELPGVGEYAARAHEIFCQGKLGDEPPSDHALTAYWHWASASRGTRNFFTENEKNEERAKKNDE